MKRTCAQPGCENGLDSGHVLYRVSPKGPGNEFVGKCSEHFTGAPDPVAQVIERDNHARRALRVVEPEPDP